MRSDKHNPLSDVKPNEWRPNHWLTTGGTHSRAFIISNNVIGGWMLFWVVVAVLGKLGIIS